MDVHGDQAGPVSAELRRYLAGLALPAWICGEDGTLSYANPAWEALTGHSVTEEECAAYIDAARRHTVERVEGAVRVAAVELRAADIEIEIDDVQGRPRTLVCHATPLSDEDGNVLGVVGICRDVTQVRTQHDQLAFMAGHDSLTGLANRRVFEDALSRAVARAKRGAHGCVVMFDVDNFKRYNDALGHLEGDQFLVNLALQLQHQLRAGDLLARIGGDEFAVLLEDTSIAEALEIADRMRASVRDGTVSARAREFDIGLSGGVAFIGDDSESREVLDRADLALYSAKAKGRNRIELWAREIDSRHLTDRMAARVQRAFAQNTFRLYYQPVIRLDDGTVAYFESLARIESNGAGVFVPGEFLPVVDRLGLSSRLTRRVVELALDGLRSTSETAVAVNVSQSDLLEAGLPDRVADLIAYSEVEPRRLVFEFPEPAVAMGVRAAQVWFDRLSRLGCGLVLDGFGTGPSMFTLLSELPVEQVKLASHVIRSMSVGEKNIAVVRALRELIESHGKVAVASYLENDELLEHALRAGFSVGQGYRFQRPDPDLPSLVKRYARGRVGN